MYIVQAWNAGHPPTTWRTWESAYRRARGEARHAKRMGFDVMICITRRATGTHWYVGPSGRVYK